MKVCFKCLVEKDLEDFVKQKRNKDGRTGACKECLRLYHRNYRRANPEMMKEHRRRYVENNSDEINAHHRAYREQNQVKLRAHRAISYRLRTGDLVKPDRCSVCYAQGRIDGHHDDYSKPLEVRWLCVPCHKAWHRLHGEGLNAHEETYG